MNKIGKCRVFADHYQFYILDKGADPFTDMPDWTDDAINNGYICKSNVIHVGTKAHLNDHWVEIYLSEDHPNTSNYDKFVKTEINISSGILSIMGPVDADDEVYNIEILPGEYLIYIFTMNIGADQFSTGEINEPNDKEMTDEEIEAREDIERYKIVLVRKDD